MASIARSLGIRVEATLGRDDCDREVDGVTVPSRVDSPLFIAIGDNRLRRRMADNIEAEFPVLIAPSAYVDPTAVIGEGTVVMQHATVQAGAVIGRHCIVNTGAVVDHECRLADFVHVSPGAVLCGNVKVGEETWIGANATVIQGLTVGARSIVGAGSTVLTDVPAGVTAVGLVRF